MEKVFKINRTLPYNLKTRNEFFSRVPKIVKYGTEISFLVPNIWSLFPGRIEQCFGLEAFDT